MTQRIVIFASGSGTNAQNIIEYFKSSRQASVVQVLTNKKDAKVLDRCKALDVPGFVFDSDFLKTPEKMGYHLKELAPDLIVLAGFLLKVPDYLVQAYPTQIINIHPALLPDYGGKGMYGMNVHKAVVANGESYSGITIHYVNEHYDEGGIIFQAKVRLAKCDSPEEVAQKVQGLEYKHFPKVIESILLQ